MNDRGVHILPLFCYGQFINKHKLRRWETTSNFNSLFSDAKVKFTRFKHVHPPLFKLEFHPCELKSHLVCAELHLTKL